MSNPLIPRVDHRTTPRAIFDIKAVYGPSVFTNSIMPPKSACEICEKRVFNLKRHMIRVHSASEGFAVAARGRVTDASKIGMGSLRCTVYSRRYLDLPLHLLRSHPEISKKSRAMMIRVAKQWDSEDSESQGESPAKPAEASPVEVVPSDRDEPDTQPPVSSAEESDASGRSDFTTQASGSDDASTDREWSGLADIIDKFQEWLQTFAGGKMEKDHASELAGKIRRMENYGLDTVCRYINPEMVGRMFEELPARKCWAPGTVTSYICAYKNFLGYLMIAGEITADKHEAAAAVVTRIGTSVYRERRRRDSERACRDEQLLLDGGEFEVSRQLPSILSGEKKNGC